MAQDLTNGHFTYTPLISERQEFRLLRLIRTQESIIECELRNFSLKEAQVKWVALSYCWGTDDTPHHIRVNGADFTIRANLHAFLTQLTDAKPSTLGDVEWIYIDAICMDQSSLAERGAQVGLMSLIYKQAVLVITWLRDKDSLCRAEGTEDAIMGSVLTNPYWTRLWIVQEILLAQHLIIIIGQHSLACKDVLHYIEHTDKHGLFGAHTKLFLDQLELCAFAADSFVGGRYRSESVIRMVAAAKILRCAKQRKTKERPGTAFGFSGQNYALFEAINLFSSQRCQVAHDKAYALLGITTCNMTPDYTLSLTELYAQLLTDYLISLGFQKGADVTLVVRNMTAKEKNMNGHYILRSLDLDPRDPAVFIVTRAVASFFASTPDGGLVLHAVLLCTWLRAFHNNPERKMSALSTRRRWFETKRQMAARNNVETGTAGVTYVQETDVRLESLRREDAALTAPAGGPTKPISEWEAVALAHCESVWARHLETKQLYDLTYQAFQEVMAEMSESAELGPLLETLCERKMVEDSKQKADWTETNEVGTGSQSLVSRIARLSQSWFRS